MFVKQTKGRQQPYREREKEKMCLSCQNRTENCNIQHKQHCNLFFIYFALYSMSWDWIERVKQAGRVSEAGIKYTKTLSHTKHCIHVKVMTARHFQTSPFYKTARSSYSCLVKSHLTINVGICIHKTSEAFYAQYIHIVMKRILQK